MENEQVQELINGLGAMAEMVHTFYDAMIKSGAGKEEANTAMQGFITAIWLDLMNAARQKKMEDD